MRAPVRTRFNPQKPFPESGVILPDLFPSPMRGSHGRLDLHDILKGEMPRVIPVREAQQAWLRIALGNGPDMDYASPNLTETERKGRLGQTRKSEEIYVNVEETEIIKRSFIKMNGEALKIPSFDGESFEFSDGFPEPLTVEPVEQAIFFRGEAEVRGVPETPVTGIHFDSGQENGWVLLGEAPEYPEAA